VTVAIILTENIDKIKETNKWGEAVHFLMLGV
jgi:hypothetical protein